MNRKDFTINGKLQGESKCFYKDGSPLNICYYTNDVLDGVSKWWYKSGTLKKIDTYKMGKPIHTLSFYENGNKQKEQHYSTEGLVSEKIWYKNGTLQSETECIDNCLHTTTYSQQGLITFQKKSERKHTIHNHGEYKYYKRGELVSVINYRLGKRQGRYCDLSQNIDAYYNDDTLVTSKYEKIVYLKNIKSDEYKAYYISTQREFWKYYCGEQGIGRQVDMKRMCVM